MIHGVMTRKQASGNLKRKKNVYPEYTLKSKSTKHMTCTCKTKKQKSTLFNVTSLMIFQIISKHVTLPMCWYLAIFQVEHNL